MGDTVSFFTYNILEIGTVTVPGSDSDYPTARLYDRSVNFLWRYTTGDAMGFGGDRAGFDSDDFGFGFSGSQAITIQVDQGSNIKNVDFLYIARHNFDSRDMTWDYSSDGNSWTVQESWEQSGNGMITKTIVSPVLRRFWRVVAQNCPNPECGEVIMSAGSSFPIQSIPNPIHAYQSNTIRSTSVGGQERFIKLGNRRARRDYGLSLSSAELTAFQSRIADLDGFSVPFLVLDKDNNYFMMRFDPIPAEDYSFKTATGERTKVDISLLEML